MQTIRAAISAARWISTYHIDQRAAVYEIRITAVGLDKTFARVSYEVDFRIYNGYKDMDIVDSENGFITGVRPAEGGHLKSLLLIPSDQ